MAVVKLLGGSHNNKTVEDDPSQKVIVFGGELFSLGDKGPNGWRYHVGNAPAGACDTVAKPAASGWVSGPAVTGWGNGRG